MSAFIDGELTEAERQQAQRHIGTCERCSAELASFGHIDRVLAAPPAVDCATAFPLLSARHDRELSFAETLVAESHISHCDNCRSRIVAWSELDHAIAALPTANPSRRVDAAVLALGAEKSRPQSGRGMVTGIALRGAVAIGLVVAVAVAALQQPGRPQIATEAPTAEQPAAPQLPPIIRTQVLVASAQQVVFNAKTNTLYVAHPEDGTVGAINATSLVDIATITVGGKPSALALNESANTVLVLDAEQKALTEIDSKTNTVVGTTALAVSGTPTAIQVDSTNGRILVAVSDPAQSQAAPSGSVVVLDSSSKKLETTRSVAVAARQVVFDDHGKRALIVSEDVVTVVDASTYRPLDQLPGGIAAAFAAKGNSTAVLSVAAGGSRLTIAGDQNASVNLLGLPISMVALPHGGFAVLVDEEDHGRIYEIAADGTPGRSTSIALVGRDLTYNASTNTYAVAGTGGVAFANMSGTTIAIASPAPATSAQGPTIPGNTTSAVAAPSAPASAPNAVAPTHNAATDRQPNLPQGATLAWAGTYRLDLVGRSAPMVVGRGRLGHLWFVDAANQLTSLDAATGSAYTIAGLPKEARIRSIEVGSSFVYAIDVAASRVYIVSLPSEKWSVIGLPFVKSSVAVAVTPDDRLWFAVADQILTLDPRDGKVETTPVGDYNVSALAADSAGRVWFADDSRQRIGLYDRANRTVTELSLPRRGALTSMVVDSTGTLWSGTDAGELFAVRNGALVASAKVKGGVESLVLDSLGAAWYLSGDGTLASLGSVRAPAAAKTLPATIAGVWFDARGDAWLADRSSPGFFIAVPEAR